MSLILILIIAFFGLFGFASTESDIVVSTPVIVEVHPEEWDSVAVGEIEGVIVPEGFGADFGLPSPFWTPSVSDIIAAEEAIAEEEGELDHFRQYVGFTEVGDQKIYVNGFCNEEPNWRSQTVFVMDGGDCFFSASYNVDTGELDYFRFNGDA